MVTAAATTTTTTTTAAAATIASTATATPNATATMRIIQKSFCTFIFSRKMVRAGGVVIGHV